MLAGLIALGILLLLALAAVGWLAQERRLLAREAGEHARTLDERDTSIATLVAQVQAKSDDAAKVREDLAGLRVQVTELERQRAEQAILTKTLQDQSALKSIEILTLREEMASLTAKASEFEKRKEELLTALASQETQLKESFGSLAARALETNNATFLSLAQQKLEAHQTTAKTELEAKKTEVAGIVAPLTTLVSDAKAKLESLERIRTVRATELKTEIDVFAKQSEALRTETARLVTALKSPGARGRWGQHTLKRVIELAGMTEHFTFNQEVHAGAGAEGNLLRPDLVIHLPGDRTIVVDAKAPLQAFLEAMEAPDEPRHAECLRTHARQVRDRIDELSAKEYQKQFESSPDVTIMFLPGDPFYLAAAKEDPELFEYALSRGIVVATPATLFAMVRAVAFGWTQASIAEDARAVLTLGQELHERLATTTEHIATMGRGLISAATAYDKLKGNIERRVLPSARKMEEHNIRSRKVIEDIPEVQPHLLAEAISEEPPLSQDEND